MIEEHCLAVSEKQESPPPHLPSEEPSRGRTGEPSQDGTLERTTTAHGEPPVGSQVVTTVSTVGPVHSVFTKNQKRFIVVMASWAGQAGSCTCRTRAGVFSIAQSHVN